MKSSAFNGADLLQGPFVFVNNQIASVILRRDGQALPFRTGYLGPLTAEHHYMSMVQNTGMVKTNFSTGVTIDEFRNGPCTLFSFNLAPDYDHTACQETTGGNLNLDIKFSNPINFVCTTLLIH